MEAAAGLADAARRGSMASDVMMQDSSSDAHPSAYMAPAQVRAQADRDHSRGGSSNERLRGNLTADNLAGIPEADQVAPGIRLETAGAEYHMQSQGDDEQGQNLGDHTADSSEAVVRPPGATGINEGNQPMHVDGPSSTGMSGRSSTGAIDNDDVVQRADDGDDEFQEAHEDALVHERVGGSGATSENASKGTSVGHFGPRGEAIPGVPPHLDPRQPHFRPPSPSAASVFSVTVQPPASPKVLASAGGAAGMDTAEGDDAPPLEAGIVDSGDETESFDNGVATPTRSEDDEEGRRDMMADYAEEGQPKLGGGAFGEGHDREATPASSAPYEFQRLQLEAEGQHTPGSVSFNPIVTSHRGSVSSFYSGRAPSIAATAGSSRAPSTRGLSPPPTESRAGTSSSIEEFDSTGTGLMGETGNETPSVGRSRRSSYSAPSSEAADGGVGAAPMHGDEAGQRGRGATLVASTAAMRNNLAAYSSGGDMQQDDDDTRSQPTDGPSLAPSEAGSDSTRSVANDSSLGHGTWVGGVNPGMTGTSTSSDRYNNLHHWGQQQSPVIQEPSSVDGASGMAGFAGPGIPSSSSGSGLKSPMAGVPPPPPAQQAALPNLLAIKRAARRQSSSAAASTAGATTGTASPTSSLSIDGDINEPMDDAVGGEVA